VIDLDRWRDVWRRFRGRGAYPHELAFLLEVPLRGLVLSPGQLVRRLPLHPVARVLEIGPGPGYFSRAVAQAIPAGRLQLLDLQAPMLRRARRRLAGAGVRNIDLAQGDAVRLPFRSALFDLVFLVAVLGEVEDAGACLREVARVLRPCGALSVTELPGDPDALHRSRVRQLAEAVGFEPVETRPLHRGYTTTFRKPRCAA